MYVGTVAWTSTERISNIRNMRIQCSYSYIKIELPAYLSEYIGDLALHGGKCHGRQLLLVLLLPMQLELMNYSGPEDHINTKKINNNIPEDNTNNR